MTFAINIGNAHAEPSHFNINLENNYGNNYRARLINFIHESADVRHEKGSDPQNSFYREERYSL